MKRAVRACVVCTRATSANSLTDQSSEDHFGASGSPMGDFVFTACPMVSERAVNYGCEMRWQEKRFKQVVKLMSLPSKPSYLDFVYD
jgi:hypothetical protein